MMPVLSAIDLLGIQRFIFSSNRLRDAVGASRLVARACTWNADGPLAQVPEGSRLMAAGGNALMILPDLDEARALAGRYSRWLHDHAHGLEAAIVHREFQQGELVRAIRALQIELARTKTERRPSVPLLGMSVTASCRETGLPAVGFSRLGPEPPVPASRTTIAVRGSYKLGRRTDRWAQKLQDLQTELKGGLDPLVLPRELDLLGRTHGDTSLMGVVHIDGNGVGAKIQHWLEKREDEGCDDSEVRAQYHAWSSELDGLADRAMTAVLKKVVMAILAGTDGKPEIRGGIPGLSFVLHDARKDGDEDEPPGWCVPVRPVLVGGDDLTFVCDGRLALSLAETALAVFDEGTVTQLGRVPASAGVALVRSHAPFSRAYELAEGLCREAKGMLREQKSTECALDWHLGATRPGETVGSIRQRQYQGTGNIKLTARPLRLGLRDDPGTWRWIDHALLGDAAETSLRGPLWRERRNKIKALREIAREGPREVCSALDSWKIVERDLALPAAIADGFLPGECTPLLDAIELFDIHLPLG